MRGKRNICTLREDHNGITPAGAGKTPSRERTCVSREDHPRRCGENVDMPTEARETLGSPPQVRGKRHSDRMDRRRDGITPAGAGKTCTVQVDVLHMRDHPRRCGENLLVSSEEQSPPGSPPQVRGKHGLIIGAIGFHRITPAGAGKTSLLIYFSDPIAGSPPQVRGKLSFFSPP